jgi:C-terminal processing protease CtpA/Prc
MRVLASFAALAVALSTSSSTPLTAARPGANREEALVALCRLWNAVRFMHPGLENETDARWDDALIAAEPLVERDPAALREAAAAMLATLDDPLTSLDLERKDAPAASPTVTDSDGVRIVRLNGFPSLSGGEAWTKALAEAWKLPAEDHAIIVDLRAPAPPSFAQIDSVESAWSQQHFISRFPLANAPIALPTLAQRYYIGFPPESGATSGSYREGRETFFAGRIAAPANVGRAISVAFVTGANAVVPEDALALERAGVALIFSADTSSGILPGSAAIIDAGGGLRLAFRTSAALRQPKIWSGGLESANAYVRRPEFRPAEVAEFASAPPTIAERYAATALPDQAHRALAAFRMWGTIAYLYPYKDLMHDDWDAALRVALADLRASATSLEYDLALAKMYAHLHDTHGFLTLPAVREAYAMTPAFLARDVEAEPTIVRVDPVAAKRDGFAVGDVIETVDGEPVAARAARLRPYVVASTEQSVREILDGGTGQVALFAGPAGSTAVLRLRDAGGRVREVRTPRVPTIAALLSRTRPTVDILPGNVGYADLQRLNVADVGATLQRFRSTRAIVFDLRGYPRGTASALAPHFAAKTVRAALFRTPVRRVPIGAPGTGDGLQFIDETRDFYPMIAPEAPRYTQPVVVIIDARAISHAEHTGLYLAASAHARFVGEPTVGANGDTTHFFLPGGVAANFTGQAVLHPDGTRLQRVGLIPDVKVSPTLHGVRSGEDELLAAGLSEALRLGRADAATTREALAGERARERADVVAQLAPPPAPQVAPAGATPLPDAFAVGGNGYEGGHDPAVRHSGGSAIVLRAGPNASAYGIYKETIPLEPYLGKRVRVSGYLRSAGATSGAFWLRVDGPAGILAFDNMGDRALSGTRDWTPFSIVLNVPPDARQIVGGLLLQGAGTLWADDLRIDVVDPRVPTTGSM